MNINTSQTFLDPYQELALAEELYENTIKIGRNMPKDMQSQDIYYSMLEEAKQTLENAYKNIAIYESDIYESENSR